MARLTSYKRGEYRIIDEKKETPIVQQKGIFERCDEWLDNNPNINELPRLFFELLTYAKYLDSELANILWIENRKRGILE